MSDRAVVLDASALLALLQSEPGAHLVAELLPEAVISAVNLSEVVAKLAEHGMPDGAIRSAFEGLMLSVRDFDAAAAVAAGLLRPRTKAFGLSLGDRACLTLARDLGRSAVTTDRRWSDTNVGVDVEVIR
ncbi:MAG: type II toxin-antitoxin system VapC family toxin [Ardenticatenales bacterium]|nr:type II toxin-antitoxin system VapC family toxin [Ardenticatenales bacterium]